MKRKIILLIIAIIYVVIFVNENTDVFKLKGSFEEIILEKFKEKQFHRLVISKNIKLHDSETRFNYNPETINQFLEYLKTFELREISSENVPQYSFPLPYDVGLTNNNTYETFHIYVINEEYIRLNTETYKKKIDKEKNMITYEDEGDFKFYKLINKKLDYDYLDEILSKSESKKRYKSSR